MASKPKPMSCPRCGAEMNQHAEKLVHPTAPGEAADRVLGGSIEELWACRACGAGASRPAPGGHDGAGGRRRR